MSTSCTTSATGTTTSLVTKEAITTSFTESFSTALPVTTTITSETCVLGSLSGLPCLSTSTTITSTIPASVITTSVPVVATVPITETDTLTLFGSSCTVITSAAAPSNSSSVSAPAPASGSGSFSALVSTPPPVIFTLQSASTLGNGQVTMVPETITSTPPASTVYVPEGPTGQVAQENDDGGSSPRIAPIVGGVVAGFFGLLGIALIIWFIMKRRRRWDDIFEKEDTSHSPGRATKRFSLDGLEIEPKPYQYGLVGQTRSPSVGISPPSSPPMSSSSPSLQLPRHNLTPLLLPTSASTPGPSVTTLSSRPSTAGSMRPLRDGPASPPTSGHKHSHTTSSGSSTSVHISPAVPSRWGHHSPSPSADQGYFERSGSPTNYEPPRRLQLANIGDDEVGRSSPTSSLLQGPALLDGKGRHVRLGSGGPGVLVHTDAGPAPPDFQP